MLTLGAIYGDLSISSLLAFSLWTISRLQLHLRLSNENCFYSVNYLEIFSHFGVFYAWISIIWIRNLSFMAKIISLWVFTIWTFWCWYYHHGGCKNVGVKLEENRISGFLDFLPLVTSNFHDFTSFDSIVRVLSVSYCVDFGGSLSGCQSIWGSFRRRSVSVTCTQVEVEFP